jgi:hypothetical protein
VQGAQGRNPEKRPAVTQVHGYGEHLLAQPPEEDGALPGQPALDKDDLPHSFGHERAPLYKCLTHIFSAAAEDVKQNNFGAE